MDNLKIFSQVFYKKLVGGVGGETPDIITCSAGAWALPLPTPPTFYTRVSHLVRDMC